MGLELKSPIIVSSSGLTNSVKSIKNIEDAGAGAVVLKSLFEEQINFDAGHMMNQSKDYPEAEDYIRNYAKHNSLKQYLDLIRDAKKETSIPVFASINCISADDWMNFAMKIQEAGADGLELNIHVVPTDKQTESKDIELKYYQILENVKEILDIPVAIKFGIHFTNILRFINQLHYRGADAVVLFNRFYEPDINIDSLELVSSGVFSRDTDIRHSLRWVVW